MNLLTSLTFCVVLVLTLAKPVEHKNGQEGPQSNIVLKCKVGPNHKCDYGRHDRYGQPIIEVHSKTKRIFRLYPKQEKKMEWKPEKKATELPPVVIEMPMAAPPEPTVAPTEAPIVPPTEAPNVPSTEAPMLAPTEAPVVVLPTLPSTTTMKYILNHEAVKEHLDKPKPPKKPAKESKKSNYVLNEEAAKKYWATAKFETTAAPLPPPMTAAPVMEEVARIEPVVVKLPKEVKPEVPPPSKQIKEKAWKYVHNEEAAKKNWATAKFETTAVPLPLSTTAAPVVEEVARIEPVVEVPKEVKPVPPPKKQPKEKAWKYVHNEEAAKKYWATAKFETTAAPLPAPKPVIEAAPPAPVPKVVVKEEPMKEVVTKIVEKDVGTTAVPLVMETPVEKAEPVVVVEKVVEVKPKKPLLDKPIKKEPKKYELNEDEAKIYWAKIKETTTAVPMPLPEQAPVQKIEFKKPVTPGYVLNEDAAHAYWATAKTETTAAPLPAQAQPVPFEIVKEKPIVPQKETYVLNEEAAKAYWATAAPPHPAKPAEAPKETPIVLDEPAGEKLPCKPKPCRMKHCKPDPCELYLRKLRRMKHAKCHSHLC